MRTAQVKVEKSLTHAHSVARSAPKISVAKAKLTSVYSRLFVLGQVNARNHANTASRTLDFR